MTVPDPTAPTGVPHDHPARVPGCFRCDLSADEVTAPTVVDVIAEAIRDGLTPLDGRHALTAATTAVVAAVRGMSPEQLRDLRPDLTIERALFGHKGGHYRTALDAEDEAHLRSMAAQSGGEIRSRVVGPWQAEP